DTDAARSTEDAVTAILDSLQWLGLEWDEGPGVGGDHAPYFQSQRRELYRQHGQLLLESGRAYRCYCTPPELEARRALTLERGEAPRYDGRCQKLSDAERARLEARGTPAALRFALDPRGAIAWQDLVRGRVLFQNEVLDDFVLIRSDGLPTY